MTLQSAAFTALIVIFVVTINSERAQVEATSIKNITNEISRLCNEGEELPEKICDISLYTIKKKVESSCEGKLFKPICEHLPWPLQYLHVTPAKCENELTEYVCGPITAALNYAKLECVGELDKLVIGSGCDASGNKQTLCEGIPKTFDGICTMAVDELCDKLPFFLDPIIPYCQRYLAEYICERIAHL